MLQSADCEEVEKAKNRLFSGHCVFLRSVASLEQLPLQSRTEIAFAGRSNVGKSSLINALTGCKTMAKISSTPGRTRELNFFELGETAYLVDMPGYGYARASKNKVKSWTELMLSYLAGRAQLERIFLLIDSRHSLKEPDRVVMDLLDRSAVVYQVVLTKVDCIKQSELESCKENLYHFLRKRPAAYPEVLTTSSRKQVGIQELRTSIFDLLSRN